MTVFVSTFELKCHMLQCQKEHYFISFGGASRNTTGCTLLKEKYKI